MSHEPNALGYFSNLLKRPETTRAWDILVNGRRIVEVIGEDVKSLVVVCARDPKNAAATILGYLEYGAEPKADGAPSAYDSWIFWEMGGAVTVPFAVMRGRIYVGLVKQRRNPEVDPKYNPTGMVVNVPRGFHNVKGIADETAKRELRGEVGVFEGETFRLFGENMTANNAWFGYRPELGADGEPVRQGGVAYYAVEVKAEHLVRQDDTNYGNSYVFDPAKLGERPKGSPYEVIGNCVFVEALAATTIRDGFTLGAVARLINYLVTRGRFDLLMRAEVELAK